MIPPEFAHTGGQLVIRSEKILHYNHVYDCEYDCEFETEILLLLFFFFKFTNGTKFYITH